METFSPLAENRIVRRYSPGQVIYLQGTPAHEFYYLVRGTAKSYISSPNGGERILTFHHSGDLMGEASFFDECPRVSSSVAVTDCDVISVSPEHLDHIFKTHPDLALPMLRYLAKTVRLLSNHVDEATFLPANQRLARYLLSEAAEGIPFPCTHEELGFAIGASRVTVSRLLSDYTRRKIVRTGYRSLTVIDLHELKKESGI